MDEITEIRTCCGFRENMIQVANKPFDVSRLELACLLISWMFHPRYHALMNNDSYNALKEADGLIITGPTGTNVNDVAVVLIGS